MKLRLLRIALCATLATQLAASQQTDVKRSVETQTTSKSASTTHASANMSAQKNAQLTKECKICYEQKPLPAFIKIDCKCKECVTCYECWKTIRRIANQEKKQWKCAFCREIIENIKNQRLSSQPESYSLNLFNPDEAVQAYSEAEQIYRASIRKKIEEIQRNNNFIMRIAENTERQPTLQEELEVAEQLALLPKQESREYYYIVYTLPDGWEAYDQNGTSRTEKDNKICSIQ